MSDQSAGTNDPSAPSSGDRGAATPGRRKRLLPLLVPGAILLLIVIAFLRGGSHTPARKRADEPQPVAVSQARLGDMPVILQLLGTVVPITNVTITPRVNGHILRVYYQEGQEVHKGEELELIDPRPYEAVLAQYEGTLAADRAQLQKARVDNARYQKLIRQNSTSAMTARDQQFLVQQLEGQVKFDEANVRSAKLNVMYCHILAPVDGRVGIRALDVGNYVTAGQAGGLTTLTQMKPISVIFTLPQNQLPLVSEELRRSGGLQVQAWDGDNLHRLAMGFVRALDSQIDTATGTVRLRGIFPNDDEGLFPNEFVNIHLLVKTLQNVLLVPSASVQTGPDGPFLYVVKPDMTVSNQPVKTGLSDETQTVILSGISAHDRVVTDGFNHLRPGSPVSLVHEASHSSGPSSGGTRAAPADH